MLELRKQRLISRAIVNFKFKINSTSVRQRVNGHTLRRSPSTVK